MRPRDNRFCRACRMPNFLHDPVDKDGMPQLHQVKDRTTPYAAAQPGADVRAGPLPGTEPVLSEGLVRKPQGPLNPRSGRNTTD